MERPRSGSRAGTRADGEPSQIWIRFAIAGAALIAAAGVLTTCTGGESSGSSESPDSVFAASTVADDAVARWYDGTGDIRQRVADDVAAIRTYVADDDGAALQPACTRLGDDVTEGKALTTGPDTIAQNLFDAGLDGYGDGVTACGNLFDGTRIGVATLQERLATGLTTGDEQWAALATRLSLPMATAGPVPSTGVATSAASAPSSPGRPTTSPTARPSASRTTPAVTATRATAPPAATTTAPPSPTETVSPTTSAPPVAGTTEPTKPPLPSVGGVG